MSQEPNTSQEPTMLLSSQGTPYKDLQAAQSALASRRDVSPETHEPHPYGDGYALFRKDATPATSPPSASADPELIYELDGKPFLTLELAEKAFAQRNISAAKYQIASNPTGAGGFCLKLKPEEKYYRVRFSAKGSPNDLDWVELSVNGETLQIERNKEVILPERYIENARHAEYQLFKTEPGKDRMVLAPVAIFPFNILGESTKAEFDALRAEGNRIRTQADKNRERAA